LIIQKKKKIYY